jgi:hypothetical protein
MLTRLRKYLPLAFVAIGLVGAVVAEWYSSALPNQPTNNSSNANPKASRSAIAVPETPEDRIAIYTWWLTTFTCCLVVVSAFQGWVLIRADRTANRNADAAIKAAEAAQLQARAAVAAEISDLAVVSIMLVPYPDALPGHPDIPVQPGSLRQTEFRVIIHLANIGRTRSRMREFCIEWCVVPRIDKNA